MAPVFFLSSFSLAGKKHQTGKAILNIKVVENLKVSHDSRIKGPGILKQSLSPILRCRATFNLLWC